MIIYLFLFQNVIMELFLFQVKGFNRPDGYVPESTDEETYDSDSDSDSDTIHDVPRSYPTPIDPTLPDMMSHLDISERSTDQHDGLEVINKTQGQEPDTDPLSEIQDVLGSYLQEDTQERDNQINTDSNQNKGSETNQEEASGGEHASRSDEVTEGSEVRQRSQKSTTKLPEQAVEDNL